MDISVVRGDATGYATPLLALGIFEGESQPGGVVAEIDRELAGRITRVVASGDFRAKEGQTVLFYPEAENAPMQRVLVIGLGKRNKLDAERLRRAAATAVKQATRLGVERVTTILQAAAPDGAMSADGAAQAVAEGAELGSYVFDELKSKGDDDDVRRVARFELLHGEADGEAGVAAGVRRGSIVARAENFARRLGNLPGNVATPSYLAEQARQIAERFDQRLEILGPAEMEREGMGAILAVARGSEEEPRLIVIEHSRGPEGAKPLLLVGKGLTFDSGGISIKPSAGMEEMKFDMCGGAAVLAAMSAIGELGVPLNVVGIVPSSENLLSGRAIKPGDVIHSHAGKTIEIINTDAEGRLILADALSYGKRFDPAAIVDVATLTGACVVALGSHASGGMTNDEGLLEEIRDAGSRVGERVWPLPLFEEYRELLKSEYADLKNSGGRWAGAITAGWFLREFVGDIPWVHLDVAGTAYGDGKLAYQSKGATGVPTRLLVDWVLSRAA